MKKISQPNYNQPSLFFDSWAQDKVVTDPQGLPKQLYHGTTHEFDEFQILTPISNSDNYFGKGFYFTDSPEDASENYTSEGADLKNKIELEAEKISDDLSDYPDNYPAENYYEKYKNEHPEWFKVSVSNNDENNDIDEQEETIIEWSENPAHLHDIALQIAKDELHGKKPNVMPVFVKMENPVNLTPENPTYFNYEYADEDDDEHFVESGTLIDLLNVIRETVDHFGGSEKTYNEIAGEIFDKLDGDTEISAFDIDKILRNKDLDYDFYNEDYGNFSAEVFKNYGFDGIIMYPSMHFFGMKGLGQDTKHYIIWNNKNIKSAIGNTGLYDPSNPKITANSHKTKKIAKKLEKLAEILDYQNKFKDADIVVYAMKNLLKKRI